MSEVYVTLISTFAFLADIAVVVLAAWAVDTNIRLRIHTVEINSLNEKFSELEGIVKKSSVKTKVILTNDR